MSSPESFDDNNTINLGGIAGVVSGRVLRPGEVIGGTYKLKSLLGHGGMGYVFCVEHTIMKRDYALKMIAPERLTEASRRRFETEGRAIANLDHPNIVKVYNMGLDGGDCPFYVMDLLDGMALSDYINVKQDSAPHGIALDECLDIFIQIASGLGYANGKGIVHRDVKPSNIVLLTEISGRRLAKIVDFGIAKLLPSASVFSESQTATGDVFGSPLYMSPEQCMGSSVDHRSDIYSLGCTLFEALCGRPPFCGQNAMATVMMHQGEPAPSILEVRPEKHLPKSIDLLLQKMMAKRPQDRYQSMKQLIHDFERIKQGKAIGKTNAAGPAISAPAAHADRLLDAIGRQGGQGQQERPDLPEAARKGPVSDGNRNRGPAIVVTFAIVLILFLSCGSAFRYLHKGHPLSKSIGSFQTAPDTDPLKDKDHMFDIAALHMRESAAGERQAAKDKLRRCVPIKSVTFTSGHKQLKKFHFPDWSIGTVYTEGRRLVDACGNRALPADKPLMLQIGQDASYQVLNTPEVVYKIGNDEFCKLEINCIELSRSSGESFTEKSQTKGVVQILKAASRWSRLESVNLVQFAANKDVFDALKDFKHLRSLQIAKVKMNAEDLLQLESCPQLRILDLDETKATIDQIVPVIPKLTKLQEVRFNGHAKLNKDEIKRLTACKNISRLRLDKERYSPKERTSYKHNEPKVSFTGE